MSNWFGSFGKSKAPPEKPRLTAGLEGFVREVAELQQTVRWLVDENKELRDRVERLERGLGGGSTYSRYGSHYRPPRQPSPPPKQRATVAIFTPPGIDNAGVTSNLGTLLQEAASRQGWELVVVDAGDGTAAFNADYTLCLVSNSSRTEEMLKELDASLRSAPQSRSSLMSLVVVRRSDPERTRERTSDILNRSGSGIEPGTFADCQDIFQSPINRGLLLPREHPNQHLAVDALVSSIGRYKK